MNEIIFMVEEAPDGGFLANGLGMSIFTQAQTFEELKTNVKDAVHCHFDEGKAPQTIRFS